MENITRFNFYNAHPEGKRVGDCVKRAITFVTKMDYHQVQLELNRYKKVTGAKVFNERKNCDSYCENVLKMKKISFPAQSGVARMNGYSFAKSFPKGRYILNMAHHWTACVDGVIYDTYDCSKKDYYDFNGDLVTNEERCVYGYWTEPTKEEIEERELLLKQAKELKDVKNQHMKDAKQKIESIKNKYNPKLSNLEKQIKKLQHELKIESNRMNREIKKLKEEDSKILLDKLLEV